MKKNYFKKLLTAVTLMGCLSGYSQRGNQVTLCDVVTSYSCTYVARAVVTACNSVPNCISIPVTHTVTPGSCTTYSFSVPTGYTITASSLVFEISNLSNAATATFTPSSYAPYSSTYWSGNCHGVGGDWVTGFTVGASGSPTYTIFPDMILGGKPGQTTSDPENSKAQEKNDVMKDAGIANASFNIYPNPSSGDVTLSFALNEQDEASIEVYNSFREKVYTAKKRVEAAENTKTQVDGLKPGMYIVVFTTSRGTNTYKFTVKP